MCETLNSQIKKAEEAAEQSAKDAERYRAEAAGLRIVVQTFADAQYVDGRWRSRSVVPDGIDVRGFFNGKYVLGYMDSVEGRACGDVLYQSIKTEHGVFRVYSHDRVDAVAAFELFNETGKPLLRCLLDTVPESNKKYLEFLRQKEQEAIRDAERKAKAAQ